MKGKKLAAFGLLVAAIETVLVSTGQFTNLSAQALALFPTILVGFGIWHHDKSSVLLAGFLVLMAIFMVNTSVEGGEHHPPPPLTDQGWLSGFIAHFADHHRAEVIYNLGYLLLGFALFSRYFEKSGLARSASRLIMADLKSLRWLSPVARLLWATWLMSVFLDNIAAVLIGGLILRTMYGNGKQTIPFVLLPALIGASNMGGAASFIGDTTTTLLYIAGVSPLVLAKGFVGTVLAQMVLVMWAVWATRGQEPRIEVNSDPVAHLNSPTNNTSRQWLAFAVIALGCAFLHLQTGWALLALLLYVAITEIRRFTSGGEDHGHTADLGADGINWPQLLPLLGIPGLVVGNLVFGQPGLGLWVGLLIGIVVGRVCSYMFGKTSVKLELDAVISAVPGTAFLVLLVSSAKLLPLAVVAPTMQQADPTVVTYGLGVGSAVFDNIPLTSISIQLGGFDWALLSYAVGFGGSMIWLGSSAGVALGTLFPEVYDTKRWVKPALVLFVVYNVGFWAIWIFWSKVVPLFP